ncbi:tumor necrosis factor receptor superfamily member 6 [Bombina bombina]|uniref:tumor necrosis factor receptor superfamily member 6 n=1 Tax=Bombina bombina TaxID=8345 RepID=UPI00235AD64D|nr:tumor necrosis factor receptor superfamily member 6 [Bombina bombina]
MKCMRCRPCDHGSGLIEVVHCSPKQKTICACPQGFQCEAYDEKGNCTFCSQTHIPDPPLTDSTTPGHLHWSIITFPILFIFALVIVLFVLFKRLALCKIGANLGQQINRRIFGKQYPSPAKHNHEIEPRIPQQEEGKHLPFPIQETEEPQCKETTPLSYSDNWTGPFPAHVATCTLLSGVPS